MPAFGLFASLVFMLLQLAAAGNGVAHFFGIPLFFGYLLAGILTILFTPVVTLAGVYGAIAAWHWHWFWAIALFFPGAILTLMALGPMALFGMCAAWRKRPRSNVYGGVAQREEDTQPTPVVDTAKAIAQDSRQAAMERANLAWLLVPLGVLLAGFMVLRLLPNGDRLPFPSPEKPETEPGLVLDLVTLAPSAANLEPAIPFTGEMLDDEDAVRPTVPCLPPRHDIDRLVCEIPRLARLDLRLATVHFGMKERAARPDLVEADHLRWMSAGRGVCDDASCLEQAYLDRIDELTGELSR
jgi:hypothetical protein